MDKMSESQRQEFVTRRVESILKSFKDFFKLMSEMSDAERRVYVHRRVESDLATFEQVSERDNRHLWRRREIWKWLVILDVVVFVSMVILVVHDLRIDPEEIGFVLLPVLAFIVSRVITRHLLQEEKDVNDMWAKMYSRVANTANLEFMVDELSQQYAGLDEDVSHEGG